MIDNQTKDLIIETARIEEVVSDFIVLKKRGVNFIGNCPFHDEKTPSFTVSPAKGIYKCFGCGKGGFSVNFVMEHEQMDFPSALRFLAKKYNIEVEERKLTPEELEKSNKRESLLVVTNYANEFFQKQLHQTKEGKAIGLSYFKERDVSAEMITKFQLGYNPNSWDAFTKQALSDSYKKEFLKDSGLTIYNGNKAFDRFKGRVMFPIHSISGKVLGFGGRILQQEKNSAKYVNSPESDIYHKSNVLYGIYFAKQQIIKKDNCYLVEGYTDVISMHQVGIENVVASSGTALTSNQIKLIDRFTKNITILFDGDSAGIKASFRGIDLILQAGMNVKIILFPDGEDPDSFSKKHGELKTQEFITKNAKDFLSFKIELLKQEVGNDPVKKVGMIKEIVKSLALIPDSITQQVYIKESSKLLEISEQEILKEIRNSKSNILKRPKKTEEKTGDKPLVNKVKAKTYHQEQNIIRFLLSYGVKEIEFLDVIEEESEGGFKRTREEKYSTSVAQFILEELDEEGVHFDDPDFQFIFNTFQTYFKKGEIIDQAYFLKHNQNNISQTSVDTIFSKYTLSEQWKEKHGIHTVTEDMQLKLAVESAIYAFKIIKIEVAIDKQREKLENLAIDEQIEVMKIIHTYLQIKKEISKKLGRIILK
jgi:DNA primase